MSEKHFIVCDNCNAECFAAYNGEHWLPPHSWAILVDFNFNVENFGQHLCPKCVNNLGKGEKKDA